MSFTIECEWAKAPEVKLPELAATWSRLRIGVGDLNATLVETQGDQGDVRQAIDVPAYPLAEWLVTQWWSIEAQAHRADYTGVALGDAGEGFPYPRLTLRPDRGQVWASLRRRAVGFEHVKFLQDGEVLLQSDEVRRELAVFIDSTVRRLEDHGLRSTLLQREWAVIQAADFEEAGFCRLAASWGFDPYDITEADAESLTRLVDAVGDEDLASELAGAIALNEYERAGAWIHSARRHIPAQPARKTLAGLPVGAVVSGNYAAPWREGFERARSLRSQLGISAIDSVPVEEFVAGADSGSASPTNVEALVSVADDSASIVRDANVSEARDRFLRARALARRTMSPHDGLSLLTARASYAERVERAFAAEFLAPAEGIRELLQGDYSEGSQNRVAGMFGVNPQVVLHQIENQLAA